MTGAGQYTSKARKVSSREKPPATFLRYGADVLRWIALVPGAILIVAGVLLLLDFVGAVFQVDSFKQYTFPPLLGGLAFIGAGAWIAPRHKEIVASVFTVLMFLVSASVTVIFIWKQKYYIAWWFFCLGATGWLGIFAMIYFTYKKTRQSQEDKHPE